MPANPPQNMPRITPNLFYDDPADDFANSGTFDAG